jgi:hypothetical protein
MTPDIEFEANFRPDFLPRCLLWVDEPTHGHIRFEITTRVLEDVLGCGNAVHHDENAQLCERERPRIEAACRRAFAEHPGARVVVEPRHFQ